LGLVASSKYPYQQIDLFKIYTLALFRKLVMARWGCPLG